MTPGQPDVASAGAVIGWIETAARLALSGEASAVVTAPIAKATLYAAGFTHPGHTEFLGELATPRDARLGSRAGHDAHRQGPAGQPGDHPRAARPRAGLLTVDAIVNAGRVTARALRRDFGIASPRLAVCGLNPHAGEAGSLGREEIEIVAPAIAALREAGIDATGPHPSDSLFHEEARGRYDAALCLYHDQALIPVKMLDFWGGVNVTLGLPIVRTSPDHGTGFDIAGQGPGAARQPDRRPAPGRRDRRQPCPSLNRRRCATRSRPPGSRPTSASASTSFWTSTSPARSPASPATSAGDDRDRGGPGPGRPDARACSKPAPG